MTNHELFEAIGHVDDDLILAADAPAKKHRKPPVYSRSALSVAACLCLLVGGISVVRLRSASGNEAVLLRSDAPEAAAATAPDEGLLAAVPNAEDAAESAPALGLARCVRIGGVNYYESAATADSIPDRDADGVIADSVGDDAFPESDDCSNFGTGYPYWISGESHIIVEIDGEYLLFEAE